MQLNEIRRLTGSEISVIPEPISKALDLRMVEIHNRRWTIFTPGNVTVARGYRIYWPGAPSEARTLSQLAHLVHEIVHVWQYNILKVGLYSPRWLDRRYGYELKPGDHFLNFGLEQQASIIEDGFIAAYGAAPRRAKSPSHPSLYQEMIQQISVIT